MAVVAPARVSVWGETGRLTTGFSIFKVLYYGGQPAPALEAAVAVRAADGSYGV